MINFGCMSEIKIHFLGAAGTVTGSKYLVEVGSKKILIDCGLFQGIKKLRQLNWDNLPLNVGEIECVLITHGHLDHCGFLPRLVEMGYQNRIYGTAPTLEIAEIILRDSAKIQEEDAERANKKGYSKHHPAKALYTIEQVDKAVAHFRAIEENYWMEISKDIKVRFTYAGHILGAATIELDIKGKIFVFSGDIGRENDLIMFPPKTPEHVDVLFIESTYGDRLHTKENIEDRLIKIVNETIAAGGTLIIPSFAVERTQLLMYLLWQMKVKKQIPDVLMVMDSPMGANVNRVFQHHIKWQKLSMDDCNAMCNCFVETKDFKESLSIVHDERPKIIIAGSGMITGGRVLAYLKEYISNPKTTVLLAGFQSEGTRGRQLLRGAAEIKIYGRYYPVNARIEEIGGLSGHADQKGLMHWMSQIKNKPEKVFIVHGEPQSSDVLRVKIESTWGWNCVIPQLWETIDL